MLAALMSPKNLKILLRKFHKLMNTIRYADDTIILGDSILGHQQLLDCITTREVSLKINI